MANFYATYPASGGGSGDVVGPSSAVDSQIALFDGTTGKLLKTATGTGVVHATSGVYSTSNVVLTSEVTGTLPIANGGTGQTTAPNAINALLPSQSTHGGQFLTTDGSVASWSVNPLGTVTSVDVSGGTTGITTSGGPVTTSGTITLAGTLAVANGGTGQTTAPNAINALLPTQATNNGKYLTTDGSVSSWASVTTGTVTSVSVTTANGVSGSVATATTTPAITLTLGAIVPSSVAASGTVTGSNLSGTNTGDVTLGAFGSTPSANAASLSGQVLTLQPASAAQPGGASTAAQSFAGLKKFEGGMIQVGTIDTSDTNVTLTNTSSRNIIYNSFSASRDVTLATTSILAGELWVLQNTTAFDMVPKASNGSALTVANGTNIDGTIQNGYLVVMPLINTPTTPAHWRVIDVFEATYSLSSSFTPNGSGAGGSGGLVLKLMRHGTDVSIKIPVFTCSSGTTSDRMILQTPVIPTRFRTVTSTTGWAYWVNNNGTRAMGLLRMDTDGTINVFRDSIGTAYTNGSNIGLGGTLEDLVPLTYKI